jgi:hypothetical protein
VASISKEYDASVIPGIKVLFLQSDFGDKVLVGLVNDVAKGALERTGLMAHIVGHLNAGGRSPF